MRVKLFLATSIIAASVGLAACSSGSQSLPGGSQAVAPAAQHVAATNGHTQRHLIAVGLHRDADCPASDFACITVDSVSGGSIEICADDGSGNCLPDTSFVWTSAFYKMKTGELIKKLAGSFNPTPGNPTTDTVVEKQPMQSSNGNYSRYQLITACSDSSGCQSGNLGIATQ